MKAAAILLAGGKSSRMGKNKALLEINEQTNIERIKEELLKLFDEVILVTNEPEQYTFLNIKTVADEFSGKGPLAGLHAGLKASGYDVNVAVACDMPFISAELAEILVKRLDYYEAVIPVVGGRQHPLFAVYHRSIIKEIESCIEEDTLRIKDLLKKIDVLYLEEDELETHFAGPLDKIFFNMNRPEEYEMAKRQAKDESFR